MQQFKFYNDMTFAELRTECKRLGIQAGRSREATMERVDRYWQTQSAAATNLGTITGPVSLSAHRVVPVPRLSRTKARQLARIAQHAASPPVYPARPGGPPEREGYRYHPTKGYRPG